MRKYFRGMWLLHREYTTLPAKAGTAGTMQDGTMVRELQRFPERRGGFHVCELISKLFVVMALHSKLVELLIT